ncbi:MAG: AAA family ATPase [Crocinitomicaceae bacterium]|nr:AAA family ATPase [Crocinitomicaceae bacterium]
MCVYLFIKWKEPQRDNFFISPLLYKPCQIKLNRKISEEYNVLTEEDDPYAVNPILAHSFSRFFDIELPHFTDDIITFIELVKAGMDSKNNSIELTTEFDESASWQLVQKKCLGNFNYKKSLLGKDYDTIILDPSHQVQKLLHPSKEESRDNDDSIYPILDLDYSQKEAITLANSDNIVIQGPPGTGKSHTIVGMIGNFIAQGKKVLFVSQKRSALQVVYDRLEELKLGGLTAFLNTEKDEKKTFYLDLKSSYDKLIKPEPFSTQEEKFIDNTLLDFYLNKYTADNPLLGDSYYNTIKSLHDSHYKPEELQYTGVLPNVKEWSQNLNFLQELEKKLIANFNQKTLGQATFTHLDKSVFAESDPIPKLAKRLQLLSEILTEILRVQNTFKIDKSRKKFTEFCLAASILNMVNKTQLNLLDQESKSYRSFGNWAKKYQLLQSKVERAEQASKVWTNKPTKHEITELIDLLKHHHAPKGILGILKRRNNKLTETFKDFDPNLSNIAKQQLLEELRTEWNLKTELEEVEIKLKHNFNIQSPETDIPHILQLRTKLSEISGNSYVEILEHEDSIELISVLNNLHSKIQEFNHISRFTFHSNLPEKWEEIQKLIEQIKKDLHQFKLLYSDLQKYFMLPHSVRDFITTNHCPVDQLTAMIYYHKLIEVTRFESGFDKLSGENLQDELDQIKLRLNQNYKIKTRQLIATQKDKIKEKEELLTTPASRLSEHEKVRKKRLRQIKKTLIHEISKKQRHMPVKQFISETWEYLSELHPVWIMNPLSVSERIECDKKLFDVVIFDESSQIPLEDAIPAIQRSKQVVVVGDDKQMPPGVFFSSHNPGPTLLDKADVSYPGKMLKWHYRSEHPELIEFSNLHFYDNELLTVPPIENHTPITFNKVDGIFESGVNITEAIAIADFLKDKKYKPSDLAIIAFSKEQENQIRKSLSKHKLDADELLIRNLENVQGIERDHIVISVGYGPNPEGNFVHNFGPVNRESGSNRLNVLFTRARKSITLFASVTADDFKMSDNPGVNCLKDYLSFAENASEFLSRTIANDPYRQARKGVMHYSHINGSAIYCFVQHESGKVMLLDPCTKERESKDLYTVYNVLNQRFKDVKILLTKDLWENRESFTHEIGQYFEVDDKTKK